MTVRRLLSHTAGLTDGLGYAGFAPGVAVPSLVETLKRPDADPGVNGTISVGLEPGSDWQYSGGGYAILQLLIEDVSGESFEAFMQRVVLRPLGMVHSTYTWAPNEGSPLATFYDRDSKPERLFSPRDWLASGHFGKQETSTFSCSRWPFRVCFA